MVEMPLDRALRALHCEHPTPMQITRVPRTQVVRERSTRSPLRLCYAIPWALTSLKVHGLPRGGGGSQVTVSPLEGEIARVFQSKLWYPPLMQAKSRRLGQAFFVIRVEVGRGKILEEVGTFSGQALLLSYPYPTSPPPPPPVNGPGHVSSFKKGRPLARGAMFLLSILSIDTRTGGGGCPLT